MHLLYVDESGSIADPNQTYFVLAGVSVFERTAHYIEQELNEIAKIFSPLNPYEIELHRSPMRSGRDGWKSHSLVERLTAIKSALRISVAERNRNGVRLFAAIIKKKYSTGSGPGSTCI